MVERRNIVEDNDAPTPLPWLKPEELDMLNRQTAYNRTLIENSQKCGCFHCGSTFTKDDIKDWLHEEDGEDTALCPYCNEDAVIVGTDDLPLSTGLLSQLYIEWFPQEYKKIKEAEKRAPSIRELDNYLRKGTPFKIAYARKTEGNFVGDIDLWVQSNFDDAWDEEFDDITVAESKDIQTLLLGRIVSVKAYFNNNDRYVCEIRDASGRLLPYEPWSGEDQDLLLNLTKKYGNKLKGILTARKYGRSIKLFVE